MNSDGLPPADQGCGKGEKALVAGFGFLIADQQFAKAVQPGMVSLDDPAASFVSRMGTLALAFLAARFDAQFIAVTPARPSRRQADVGGIRAEILWS